MTHAYKVLFWPLTFGVFGFSAACSMRYARNVSLLDRTAVPETQKKDWMAIDQRLRLERILHSLVRRAPRIDGRVTLVVEPRAKGPSWINKDYTIEISADYLAKLMEGSDSDIAFVIAHELGHAMSPECDGRCGRIFECETASDAMAVKILADNPHFERSRFLAGWALLLLRDWGRRRAGTEEALATEAAYYHVELISLMVRRYQVLIDTADVHMDWDSRHERSEMRTRFRRFIRREDEMLPTRIDAARRNIAQLGDNPLRECLALDLKQAEDAYTKAKEREATGSAYASKLAVFLDDATVSVVPSFGFMLAGEVDVSSEGRLRYTDPGWLVRVLLQSMSGGYGVGFEAGLNWVVTGANRTVRQYVTALVQGLVYFNSETEFLWSGRVAMNGFNCGMGIGHKRGALGWDTHPLFECGFRLSVRMSPRRHIGLSYRGFAGWLGAEKIIGGWYLAISLDFLFGRYGVL